MVDPLIPSQLREKQTEIEKHIEILNARLENAHADLIHVMATIRMFDPMPVDEARPVSYHGSTRALKRSELFDRCKAAMNASPEPLNTRDWHGRHPVRRLRL